METTDRAESAEGLEEKTDDGQDAPAPPTALGSFESLERFTPPSASKISGAAPPSVSGEISEEEEVAHDQHAHLAVSEWKEDEHCYAQKVISRRPLVHVPLSRREL